MHGFLARLISFSLPCAIACTAVAAAVLSAERWIYRARIRISDEVRYVVIGDSQSACAMDPSVFPSMSNQAAEGLSLDQVLYKIRDLLDVNMDRDFTIVFDLSPSRLAAKLPPLTTADYASHHALLNYLHAFDSRRQLGEPVRLFRDRIVRDGIKLIARELHGGGHVKSRKRKPTPWGGFLREEGSRYLDAPDDAASSTAAYARSIATTCSEDDAFIRNVPLLNEIVRTVQSRGKRISLVTTPWHRTLLEKLPPKQIARFRRTMDDFAHKYGVVWIDGLSWDAPDSAFLDQNHLNADGAREFSAWASKRLSWNP